MFFVQLAFADDLSSLDAAAAKALGVPVYPATVADLPRRMAAREAALSNVEAVAQALSRGAEPGQQAAITIIVARSHDAYVAELERVSAADPSLHDATDRAVMSHWDHADDLLIGALSRLPDPSGPDSLDLRRALRDRLEGAGAASFPRCLPQDQVRVHSLDAMRARTAHYRDDLALLASCPHADTRVDSALLHEVEAAAASTNEQSATDLVSLLDDTIGRGHAALAECGIPHPVRAPDPAVTYDKVTVCVTTPERAATLERFDAIERAEAAARDPEAALAVARAWLDASKSLWVPNTWWRGGSIDYEYDPHPSTPATRWAAIRADRALDRVRAAPGYADVGRSAQAEVLRWRLFLVNTQGFPCVGQRLSSKDPITTLDAIDARWTEAEAANDPYTWAVLTVDLDAISPPLTVPDGVRTLLIGLGHRYAAAAAARAGDLAGLRAPKDPSCYVRFRARALAEPPVPPLPAELALEVERARADLGAPEACRDLDVSARVSGWLAEPATELRDLRVFLARPKLLLPPPVPETRRKREVHACPVSTERWAPPPIEEAPPDPVAAMMAAKEILLAPGDPRTRAVAMARAADLAFRAAAATPNHIGLERDAMRLLAWAVGEADGGAWVVYPSGVAY